jgi:hypothetical protein
MTQYLIQIENSSQRLIKCYEITAEHPARPTPPPPPDRTQVIMTNTTSFEQIETNYNQYTDTIFFSYNESEGTISCTGAYTHTWDVD